MQTTSDIKVIDDFFSEKEYQLIDKMVHDSNWSWGHGSLPADHPDCGKQRYFWCMDLISHVYFTHHLLNRIMEKDNNRYLLRDVYANGHTFESGGYKHQDCYDDKGVTALLYVTETWDDSWKGRTKFYTDEITYVTPKRNRMVIFPGIIHHNAEKTTSMFNDLRITVAWKLELS